MIRVPSFGGVDGRSLVAGLVVLWAGLTAGLVVGSGAGEPPVVELPQPTRSAATASSVVRTSPVCGFGARRGRAERHARSLAHGRARLRGWVVRTTCLPLIRDTGPSWVGPRAEERLHHDCNRHEHGQYAPPQRRRRAHGRHYEKRYENARRRCNPEIIRPRPRLARESGGIAGS